MIILCLVLFTTLAGLSPLVCSRRLQAMALGIAGIGLALGPRCIQGYQDSPFISILRDWLPAPLMLMVYWQTGRFFTKPNERLQRSLERLDSRVLGAMLSWLGNPGRHNWISSYLELAYLLCYPLVPLGVGVLYITGKRGNIDYYWTVVLIPACLCYAMTALIHTLPPRALVVPPESLPRSGRIRALNLWVLRHASIQVNTFPSAHVAATMAASLALFCLVPLAGIVFLLVSLSIAAGSVVGRYHYFADALIAAILAGATFLLL